MNVHQQSDEPDDKTAAPQRTRQSRRRIADGLRWIFWRHLCFGGLAGALVFFCASLTPSLLPRGWLLQGVVSGVTALLGYGVGSMVSSWIRRVITSEPRRRAKRVAWRVLVGAATVLVPVFLFLGALWQ